MREVLYEIVQLGNSVKVSAIDPETNTEVCIVGSPHVELRVLRSVARRKLEYVLARKPQKKAVPERHGKGVVV